LTVSFLSLNTQLQAGDQVIAIGKKGDVEKVVKRFAAT